MCRSHTFFHSLALLLLRALSRFRAVILILFCSLVFSRSCALFSCSFSLHPSFSLSSFPALSLSLSLSFFLSLPLSLFLSFLISLPFNLSSFQFLSLSISLPFNLSPFQFLTLSISLSFFFSIALSFFSLFSNFLMLSYFFVFSCS